MEILFPAELRAMSIHLPHAIAICLGIKDYEYRSVSTNRRGLTLIHASSTKNSDECFGEYDLNIEDYLKYRRKIIGAVKIAGCRKEGNSYAYKLIDPILFAEGIFASGQQSIFWPASNEERTKAFNQAWSYLLELKYDFTMPEVDGNDVKSSKGILRQIINSFKI